jgi:hypothetical protein
LFSDSPLDCYLNFAFAKVVYLDVTRPWVFP